MWSPTRKPLRSFYYHIKFLNICDRSVWASLSADWNMKWNSGMENGIERSLYTVIANLCSWCCSSRLNQLLVYVSGMLSPCRGCMSKSNEDRAVLNFCHHIFDHQGNSITMVTQNQTLGFRMRAWLCKTTITKHLMMSQQQYHAWL